MSIHNLQWVSCFMVRFIDAFPLELWTRLELFCHCFYSNTIEKEDIIIFLTVRKSKRICKFKACKFRVLGYKINIKIICISSKNFENVIGIKISFTSVAAARIITKNMPIKGLYFLTVFKLIHSHTVFPLANLWQWICGLYL